MLLLAATATNGSAASEAKKEALSVYVVGKKLDAAQNAPLKQELEARISETKGVMDRLETELKKTYGKKESNWPADKRAEYEGASAQHAEALSLLNYREVKQPDIDASVEDLKTALAGKGLPRDAVVRLIDSPEEAHLFIEVLGRRSQEMSFKYVCLKLSAGSKLDPGTLAKIEVRWPADRGPQRYTLLHRYGAEEPFWKLEVGASGFPLPWRLPAGEASRVINDFTNENYDALTSARSEGAR
jgi:hypothetical protein